MRQEIVMPTLSEDAEEGVVVTWFVVPGASVREGDLVAEVQVEKASAEVHAPADGRLVETLVEPGGVVAQGDPIAVIEIGVTAGAAERVEVTPSAAAEKPVPFPAPASPAARRLARELDVDLSRVVGSGSGGRIVEADVRGAAGEGAARPAEVEAVAPLTSMRRAIADRLTEGLASAAQLTLTAEVDVTRLWDDLATRRASAGRRLTITDAVVRACALTIPRHPSIAARWTDSGIAAAPGVDIGVAVAVEGGLVVPVLRGADARGIEDLSAELATLAERAREARLETREMEGAVFSVTSLGAHRVDAFTPLLDPPQTGVLGVGRARMRPAVVNDQVVPRRLMVLSLTFDHRVLDGAPAAAFLDEVADLLEEPALLT